MSKDKHSVEERKARRRRLTERLETLRERTRFLEIELQDYTCDFYRVCIFGSARIKPNDEIYQATHDLALLFGKEGIDVLTGGGPGLMEAANIGVRKGKELSGSKSKSFGISIDLGKFEVPNEHLDIKHHHKKFSSRLDDFMRLSNAVVVTPGGIGTLLELYFSWQLLQVSHLEARPIVLLGRKFWEGLLDWTKNVQIKRGLISESDMNFLHVADTPEEVLEILKPDLNEFQKKKALKAL